MTSPESVPEHPRATGRPGPRLLGLLGGESTGKTALAGALAERIGAAIAGDLLREHVAGGGAVPGPAGQRAHFAAQAGEVQRASEVAAAAGLGWVIADPMPLMTAVYSLVYFDDPGLLPEGLADAAGYDLIVWCSPDIPWAAEPGMRDGPHRRAEAHAAITAHVMPRLGASVPVLNVAGPVPARVDAVLRAVLRD